jgi:OmpA-OmpF porin, OOP family
MQEEFTVSKNMLKLCFTGLALIASAGAMAEDELYFGLRVGAEMDNRFDFGDSNVDTDTPYSAYGGWNFTENWGIELGYTDVGDSIASGVADGGFELNGSLVTAGVSYRYPINERFDIFAAAGAFNLSEDGTFITIAGPVPAENDDSGAYAEFGGRFHFNEGIALRASYQWFNFDGGNDGTPWLGVEVGF